MSETTPSVVVVPYDESWPRRFEAERAVLEHVLAPWLDGGIHHVGSTAVPGLAAKPIIDMIAGVEDLEEARAAFDPLREHSYESAPHRPGTHHFAKPPASSSAPTHGLHLTEQGSDLWRERLAFRDALLAEPTLVAEYQALKVRLAQEHGSSVSDYTTAKRPFVARVLATAGITIDAVRRRPVEPAILDLDELHLLDAPRRLEDTAAWRRLDLDPLTARFFGWTVEEARLQPDSHYEEVARRFLREWNDGSRYAFTIRRRSTGEPVGSVELRPQGEEAAVSYMVAPELRGQGLAAKALEALLAWGARELGLRRVTLGCHVENVASRRVAERCGFLFVDQEKDELHFQRQLERTSHPDADAERPEAPNPLR